jgi:hypothetical protein
MLRSEIHINRKKYKNIFTLKGGTSEKVKNLRQLFMPRSAHVCQQKSSLSRDTVYVINAFLKNI